MPDTVVTPDAFPVAFQDALNGGDLSRIAALYDEDAVIRGSGGDVSSGAAAVRAKMGQLIAAGATITNTLRHVLRCGDVALIVVDYVLRLASPDGHPVEVTGTATNVIRDVPGRGWRMVIANPQGIV